MLSQDRLVLEEIRSNTLGTLADHIDTSLPVALVDLPNHGNVGDQLIVQGEKRYFDRLGLKLAYQSDIRRFRGEDLRRRMPEGTILIHGGGNFGDIWPRHQKFREELAASFGDYPIVQLPQSVYFRDPTKAKAANSILGTHPQFLLLVRESESLQRSEGYLPDVTTALVPDMAFGWSPEISSIPKNADSSVLVLSRGDHEKVANIDELVVETLGSAATISDWRRSRFFPVKYYAAQVPGEISRVINSEDLRSLLYPWRSSSMDYVASQFIKGAVKQFSPHSLVITDRLHAHILSISLGIPNIALDNEYGKIGAIYNEYTHRFSTSHFAQNNSELIALIGDLRQTD